MLIFCVFFFWPAYIAFSFALFRQKIKQQWKFILLFSIIMSQITVTLQILSIQLFVSILQPVVFFLCLRFLFRIRWIHALYMTIITFAFSLIEEFTINAVISNFKLEETIKNLQDGFFLPGMIMGTTYCLIAYTLYKTRLGFSFVRPYPFNKNKEAVDTKPALLLFIIVMLICMFCIFVYQWVEYVFIDLVMMGILFLILLRFLFEKEVRE